MATDSISSNSSNPLQNDFLTSDSSAGDSSGYGLISLSTQSIIPTAISVDGIDLMVIAFDVESDHLLLGQTDLTFTLQNQGTSAAGAFSVDILYSDDGLLGNTDDIVVGTVDIASLAAGSTLTQTVEVTLPLDVLNQRAQADDTPNQGSGFVSGSVDFLGLSIDPENVIAEVNEDNNLDTTKGRGLDDITYFPWDIDGNGLITPTDAIFAINRLGQTVDETNAAADFDGSGQITPTDAIAAINRLGYGINPEVTTPVINVELGNDTGFEATDQITSDATLSGVIADVTEVSTFQARFASASDTAFVDITDTLGSDGRFTLGPADLNTVFGGTLPEGLQTITLQTLDASGTVTSEVQLPFQFDSQGPTVSISPTAAVSDTFSSFEVTFSEAISENAFDAASYSLTTESGDPVDIVSVTQLSDSRARINLSTALSDDDYQFSVAPTVSDIAGNTVETTTPFSFSIFDPVSITELSPTNGEEMVTLNREAIIRFSKPVDPATVTSDAIKVIALGEEISGRIVVSSTEEFATFFPDEPWNPSTEVRIEVDGNQILGRDGTALDADDDGTPGGLITADFRTLPITRIPGTDVFGYVYDSYNRNPDGSNIPLEGVEIRLDALPDVVGITDENGYFILEDVPAPDFYVYIDGSKVEGLPEGNQYASLGKAFHSIPGQATQLFMDGEPFDVYLPLMAADDIVSLSDTEDTQVGFGAAAQAFLEQEFPEIDPEVWQQTQVTFVAGSAQDDEGNVATQAMIVPVAPDRLPAPLPPNMDPSLVISIQAGRANGFNREADGGVTNFDVPAPIRFPNLEGLAPGEKSLIWTFNHDAGDWEVIGTGTVSEDGLAVVSDEGVGIRAPGWHFTQPGVTHQEELVRPGDCDSLSESSRPIRAAALSAMSVAVALVDVFRFETIGPLGSAFDRILGPLSTSLGIGADLVATGELSDNTKKSIVLSEISLIAPDGLSDLADFYNAAIGVVSAIESATEALNSLEQLFQDVDDCLDDLRELIGEYIEAIENIVTLLEQADKALRYIYNLGEIIQGKRPLPIPLPSIEELNSNLTISVQDSSSTEAPTEAELLEILRISLDQALSARTFLNTNNIVSIQDELEAQSNIVEDIELNVFKVVASSSEKAEKVFYRVETLEEVVIEDGRTDRSGKWSGVLPANEKLKVSYYDPESGLSWESIIRAGNSGTNTNKFNLVLNQDSDDSDGDGIKDIGESAIGTNVNDVDTDDDGLNDFAEVQQGLDPLGGLSFPTGIIANLTLQSDSKSIAIDQVNDVRLAYVATGSHGLAIAEASQFDNPILLGQIDLTGNATDVAIDSSLAIAAVATNNGGLQLIDVSDPMLPQLQKTVSISANQVEIFQNIAYATSGTTLSAIDLASGNILQSLTLPGSGTVTDLFRENENLYAYVSGSDTFSIIDISNEGAAEVTGQINVSIASIDVGVFAANGVAYLAGSGLRTIDISDPTAPTLIGNAESFFTARDIALNGSGLALVASEDQGLALYGATNPEDTDDFITLFDTPGFVNDVAIASGIAYVADGSSGLQVINYRPFDNQGQAPTVTISTTADIDPNADGIQVFEGDNIFIQADILDDVQVRNAELLVNGEVVRNDISFPFDFSTVAPNITPEANTFIVQVRATDTGGNVALSETLTINIVPDTIAPEIASFEPANGGVSGVGQETVRIRFSEPISEAEITEDTFQLLDENNNPLDILDRQLRNDGKLVQLTYAPLEGGDYQLIVNPDDITDLAGNVLDDQVVSSNFSLVEATNFWVGGTGFWDDPTNWSTGELPTADDIVLIDAPDDAVITFRSGNVSLGKFTSRDNIVITGGTINVSEEAKFLDGVTINGNATFSGNGNIILEGESEWTSGRLTIDASSNLTNAGTLNLSSTDTQTLSGALNNAGTIVHTNGGLTELNRGTLNNLAGATYELQSGSLRNSDFTDADDNTFNNSGTFLKTGDVGASIDVRFNSLEDSTIDVEGGSLSLSGGGTSQGNNYSFSNDSELIMAFTFGSADTRFNYSGEHTVSGQGTLRMSNGIIAVAEGETLRFNVADGGTIQAGGTFEVEGTLELLNTNLGGAFTGDGTINLVRDNTWNSGRVFINAVNGVNNLGTLSLGDGLRTFDASDNGALNNLGTIINLAGVTQLNRATLNNLAGATYELQSGGLGNGDFTDADDNTFNNSGTFLKTGDVGASINVRFNSLEDSTIDVEGGSLSLSGGGTSQGNSYSFSNDSELIMARSIFSSADARFNYSGEHTVSGQGTLRMSNGIVAVAEGETLRFNVADGGTIQAGGTFEVEGTLELSNTNMGGAFTGDGTINLVGDNTWNSGRVFINAVNGVNNLGTLSLGDGLRTFDASDNGALNNLGTIINLAGVTEFNRATLNNLAGATYELQSGGLGNGDFTDADDNTFNNSGTFLKTGDVGASINVRFNSLEDSTIDIEGGSLSLSGGGTSQGNNYNFSNDSELIMARSIFSSADARFNYSGEHTVSGQGTLRMSNGIVAVAEGETLRFNVADGGNIQAGGTFEVEGTLELLNTNLGGAFTGDGTINLVGDNTWNSGRVFINAVNGVNNLGTLSLGDGLRTFDASDNGALNNLGTIINLAGVTQFNRATLNNLAGATYELQSGGLGNGDFTDADDNTFNNSGTFLKTGDVGASINVSLNNLNNGIVEIQEGTLSLSTEYVQSGGITSLNGGNLSSNNVINIQDGVLMGTGNITANVLNSGILKPGNAVGILTINGTYTQTETGTLNIELASSNVGSGFDVLDISRDIKLDGTLDVDLLNEFLPTTNDTFEVLNFTSRIGDFSLLEGLDIGNGLIFGLLYEENRLILIPT